MRCGTVRSRGAEVCTRIFRRKAAICQLRTRRVRQRSLTGVDSRRAIGSKQIESVRGVADELKRSVVHVSIEKRGDREIRIAGVNGCQHFLRRQHLHAGHQCRIGEGEFLDSVNCRVERFGRLDVAFNNAGALGEM